MNYEIDADGYDGHGDAKHQQATRRKRDVDGTLEEFTIHEKRYRLMACTLLSAGVILLEIQLGMGLNGESFGKE